MKLDPHNIENQENSVSFIKNLGETSTKEERSKMLQICNPAKNRGSYPQN